MSSLLERERDKYDAMWAVPAYANASPGAQVLPVFLDMTQATSGTVLDAGCGSGKGAVALVKAGFDVTLCDLTPEGLVPEAQGLPFAASALWADLAPLTYAATFGKTFDYVYCCDVLEHIPTPFTMLVIRRLLDVSKHGVFLSISTVPDNFGVWIGEPLHQTVQPFVQWRDQLNTIGRVIEARDLLMSGCYWVAPR
jgi:2-polyprenyl-3-methyl-5-hydroxy-6-metoxy-1,4-benzoquinol methylase